MRGNALARFSLVDSARNEFIRAYQWCLPYSGKKDLLNVSMNIADAYVRGGRFDQGALCTGGPGVCGFVADARSGALPDLLMDWHR